MPSEKHKFTFCITMHKDGEVTEKIESSTICVNQSTALNRMRKKFPFPYYIELDKIRATKK